MTSSDIPNDRYSIDQAVSVISKYISTMKLENPTMFGGAKIVQEPFIKKKNNANNANNKMNDTNMIEMKEDINRREMMVEYLQDVIKNKKDKKDKKDKRSRLSSLSRKSFGYVKN